MAYLVWPLALYERIAPRRDVSSWYRVHMRQAFRFGGLTLVAGAIALLWPMLASFFVSAVPLTIGLYAVAMLIDAILFAAWLVLALRYARRAGAGEFFTIDWLGDPRVPKGGRSPKL